MPAAQVDAIVREMQIAAPPEVVYTFLTDAQKLVRWMGRSATLDARVGGAVAIDYNGFDLMRGEFVELVPPTKVVMTWGWASEGSPLPPGASTLEFHLRRVDGGTHLRMVHHGLAAEDQRAQHAEGWDHFLDRLAVVAEGRDPGPDPWAPTQGQINAAALRDLLAELRTTVEPCPADRWTTARTAEGWTVAAGASHVLGHLMLVDFILSVAAGNPGPVAGFSIETLDQMNRESAAANAARPKAALLADLDQAGPAAIDKLKALTNEDFEKSAAMAFAGGAHLSVAQIVAGPLLSNVAEHVASVKAAIA